MRRRTRITGWVMIILGLEGAIGMWFSPSRSDADRAILTVCGLAVAAMWIAILMHKQWARNVLLAVLAVQLVAVIHNAAGFSGAHGPSAVFFWAGIGIFAGAIAGWQVFVLLTENHERS